MSEMTRAELQRRMDEVIVDDFGIEEIQENVVGYLTSGVVNSTLIGRHYSVSDEQQRQEFAEWFTGLCVDIYRYQQVMEQEAENDDEDE